MIEGIIILVIVVTIGVAALLALTYWTAITAFFADLSAAVISITTGTATFLTQWFYWAIEPTNYFGWAWISTWALLLAYAAYEIATSDKGWRNAIGRRSNPIALMLCIFLIAQPFVISYGALYLSDATTSTVIDYNVQEQFKSSSAMLSNATSDYWNPTQTEAFDNETYETIIPSLDFTTVSGTLDGGRIQIIINTTILSGHTTSKLLINYLYSGTGNVTAITLYKTIGGAQTTVAIWGDILGTTELPRRDLPENGTVYLYPALFQANQFEATTQMTVSLYFTDAPDFPMDGDYVSMALIFYEASTIYTQELLMQYLALALAAINVTSFIGLSGLYKKIM